MIIQLKALATWFLGMSLTVGVHATTPSDPLIGLWKTIDDRTGYSLADVVIRKDQQSQQYSATIIQTRNAPGATPLETCQKCTGKDKNRALVGMNILTGLTAVNAQSHEFRGGTLLDPYNGHQYQARAKLMSNGKHLVIYSSTQNSPVGRNMTWVKQ